MKLFKYEYWRKATIKNFGIAKMEFFKYKYWRKAITKDPGIIKWCSHWESSLDGKRSPLRDELPWMAYRAIDWLNKYLTGEMTVFEWGSGGSSLFFAQRVKQVITVEHDRVWYQQVYQTVMEKGCKNILLNLVEPVQAENIDIWYTSTIDLRYTGLSFEQYTKMIHHYPDEFFDLVMVDGRARPGCIKHALSKVKKGGYLLLDNSERVEYQSAWEILKEWKSVKFWGPGPYNRIPWETRIWQKSDL